jgi:hypothetical protein
MEERLPPESFIIGVDEHTAVVLDLDARTATVVGNGTMTIRQHGHSIVHPSGDAVAFDALTAGVVDAPLAAVDVPVLEESEEPTHAGASLRADTDRIAADFERALQTADIDACVESILELEQTLLDWSADTLTSDEGDHARATLRQMVVKLGDLARSVQGSNKAIAPLMDVLVAIRKQARDAKDFATSDQIRDQLGALDIEIRDTPDGAIWERR